MSNWNNSQICDYFTLEDTNDNTSDLLKNHFFPFVVTGLYLLGLESVPSEQLSYIESLSCGT